MARDHERENAKRCPHCDGTTTYLHMLKDSWEDSGWRHICRTCGDLGRLPDPPKTDQEAMLEHLTKMKKRLAWISESGNRWPLDSETRKFVRMSELRNPPDDEWRRGQSDAFQSLWPIFCQIEARAIAMGLIEGPIELDPIEQDAIPF